LVFDSILGVISFLTIIPIPKSTNVDLNNVAKHMYLFPLVGALIGIIVGIFAYFTSIFLARDVSALLVTIVLMIITGLHHTDALADFSDGLMVNGNKDIRKRVMSDPRIGSAGAVCLILYIVGLIIALSSFNSPVEMFIGIIIAEILSKYIMTVQAYKGRPAWEGLSSPFAQAMKNKGKLLASTVITIIFVWFLGGFKGFMMLFVSLLIGFMILYISKRKIGGISGDVLGASNEIIRISSLLFLSIIIMW
jgi:adenosylcobinamide-GDP ribazoletransferase